MLKLPQNFVVPQKLETEKFILRPLTIDDAVNDYEALMTSIDHLQKTKPFGKNHHWPTKDFHLKQNMIDLAWHQKEFQRQTSFAYTVSNLGDNQCLGCVYFYPSENINYDVKVILWVRESMLKSNLDQILYQTVKQWLDDQWPFKSPGFPGREVPWDKW